jgi:hypothetical protein
VAKTQFSTPDYNRIWPELNTGNILTMRPRKSSWGLSGNNRWSEAIDRAAQLLETVAEEMLAYSGDRSNEWQCQDIGVAFQDNLADVIELQDELDDLRSNF